MLSVNVERLRKTISHLPDVTLPPNLCSKYPDEQIECYDCRDETFRSDTGVKQPSFLCANKKKTKDFMDLF